MNLAVFNVKFSPNLGDGLIAECLEHQLMTLGANKGLTVNSIDLAGRTRFTRGDTTRVVTLKLLDRLPNPVRRATVYLPTKYKLHSAWIPHYRRMSKAADAIIIGGGNLFSDADLNFPVKLNGALNIISDAGVPAAIYGVGVARDWTPKGLDLLREGLKKSKIKYVSVRDPLSKVYFDKFFSDAAGMTADVVYDPALLISKLRPRTYSHQQIPMVGLNITSAIAVRYHSTLKPRDNELADWYIKLCTGISAAGYSLAVFTNGSPEDDAFLNRLKPRLLRIARLELCHAFNPHELSDLISRFSVLIAHRMHAIVTAYSYRIPFIPLAWDIKIKSLLDMLGVQAITYEAVKIDPAEILNLIDNHILDKDEMFESRETVLAACSLGMRKVAEKLSIC